MMVDKEPGDLLTRLPPWSSHFEDPPTGMAYNLAAAGADGGDYSLCWLVLAAALQYLPCSQWWTLLPWTCTPLKSFSLRCTTFKVRRCTRGGFHDRIDGPLYPSRAREGRTLRSARHAPAP